MAKHCLARLMLFCLVSEKTRFTSQSTQSWVKQVYNSSTRESANCLFPLMMVISQGKFLCHGPKRRKDVDLWRGCRGRWAPASGVELDFVIFAINFHQFLSCFQLRKMSMIVTSLPSIAPIRNKSTSKRQKVNCLRLCFIFCFKKNYVLVYSFILASQ